MSDNAERHQVSLEPGVWIKVRPEQVRLTERRIATWYSDRVTIETVLEPVDGDAIIVETSMVAGMKLDAEQAQMLRDHGFFGSDH